MNNMLLIYNAHLVDRNVDIKNGAILISGDKIEGFVTRETVSNLLCDANVTAYDAKGCIVTPSFIDTHAHFRDPGLTHKEDIVSGSKAAAAGGYGTVVLMPNTNPVVSSLDMALANNQKGKEAGCVNVIQSVSITKDFDGKTISHLDGLDSKRVPLITEDGKEVADSSVMRSAMSVAAKKKIIVSCHSEDPTLAASARELRTQALKASDNGVKAGLLSQANELLALAEDCATYRNIQLAHSAGCHVHLCHVSTKESMDCIRRAKHDGYRVTCEVTPHHLGLTGDKEPGIFDIVNPPLRSSTDQKALIEALRDGTADCIGTDHAPHTAEDKANGAPGFSGIETSFAVCYTKLCRENGFTLKQLSNIMSARPAEILGLKTRGLLEEGFDADLVVIDETKEWTVCGKDFVSKGKYTPLEGKKLFGQVITTFLDGQVVYQK